MNVKIVREGKAKYLMMLYAQICFKDPEITIYENGAVTYKTKTEEGTLHLMNCEILWETSSVWGNPTPTVEGNAIPFRKK